MKAAVILVTFALAAAACGGSSGAPPASTPTPTATPAAGTGPAAEAKVPPPGQPIAKAVEFEQLMALFPEVGGWTRGKPRGEQVTLGVPVSQAKVEYKKEDAAVDLMITDSSNNPLVLAPFTMFLTAGFSERSNEGYAKAAPLNGHPGFERWNNDSRRGEVTVVVGNRFVVQAIGHNVSGVDPVRALVRTIDFRRLASLK